MWSNLLPHFINFAAVAICDVSLFATNSQWILQYPKLRLKAMSAFWEPKLTISQSMVSVYFSFPHGHAEGLALLVRYCMLSAVDWHSPKKKAIFKVKITLTIWFTVTLGLCLGRTMSFPVTIAQNLASLVLEIEPSFSGKKKKILSDGSMNSRMKANLTGNQSKLVTLYKIYGEGNIYKPYNSDASMHQLVRNLVQVAQNLPLYGVM